MKKTLIVLVVILLVSLIFSHPVRADVAPPEMPPGSNLVPGAETTQVRMAAETVILTVTKNPADSESAIASTDATFTMRNLGGAEETMQARFPLTFFNGNSDGFGRFPEIAEIAVKVNGKSVSTRREMQPFLANNFSYEEADQIPWAVFDVTFPPLQDVTIKVAYTVNSYGYYPYDVFKYILETGAGWNGTIGAADVIVRFPYEVSEKNVLLKGGENSGYGEPSAQGVVSGNELRWHFEDFEPTSESNIMVTIVSPSLWETVLNETANVTKNPNDGEAWGRLGKAYKEVIRFPKGYLRTDPAALEMYALSRAAYEKCLSFLPKDSLWHYGYADLLWSHYYFDVYWMGKPDVEGLLPLVLSHLQTALAIDPNNQKAHDLLEWISYSIPEAVKIDGDAIIYLGLTATPLPPTSWVYPTDTASPTLTQTVEPLVIPSVTVSPTETEIVPTEAPTKPNPLCGSSALIVPVLAGALWISRRHRV
jgi:hypothetical protein